MKAIKSLRHDQEKNRMMTWSNCMEMMTMMEKKKNYRECERMKEWKKRYISKK